MTKKFNIETEEIQRILSLHEDYKKSLVKEQVNPTPTTPQPTTVKRNRQELIQFFAAAKAYGCLSDPNLIYDSPFRVSGQDRGYIKGPSGSLKGMDKRVYDDFKYEVVDPKSAAVLKTGTWTCTQLEPKKPEVKPEQPKTLNSNQQKVLDLISPLGWFNQPAPTDVEVDQNLFSKINIADESDETNNPLGHKYGKYFKADYPKGYFVYKQNTPTQPDKPGRGERVNVDAEGCKTAIESLWDHLQSPTTYPLTNAEINSYRQTAETCAEPANRKIFLLRFGLEGKLKDLAKSKYAIKIR
jgi:hypothetical protein